jgi:hypothetical protein
MKGVQAPFGGVAYEEVAMVGITKEAMAHVTVALFFYHSALFVNLCWNWRQR